MDEVDDQDDKYEENYDVDNIDDYVTGITDSVSSRSSGALNQCDDLSDNLQKSKMLPEPVVLVVDGHLFSCLMGVEISAIEVNMVGVMTVDNLYQDQCLE